MTIRRALPFLLLAAAAWFDSSCAPGGFRDPTTISGVRILASSADTPYAKPGSTFDVTVLAYDGRSVQPEPMKIYWVPFACVDPDNDAYYSCFKTLATAALGGDAGPGDAGDAGAGDDSGSLPRVPRLPTGVDLGLPTGTTIPVAGPLAPGAIQSTFQFHMPESAVTAHQTAAGTPVPYGMAILFNIACAGHIEALPLDPTSDNPVQVPLGCFDENHNQLTPDDYVIGYTRVYAFGTLTNANPELDRIDVQGQTVALTQPAPPGFSSKGFTTTRCTASRRDSCPKVNVGPVVPPSSWELNPESLDSNGNALHEEIWADFFSTFGQFTASARLLYDAKTGSLGGPGVTDNEFLPPSDPGDGFIWIVVRDGRGGASWAQLPVHVN